MDSKFLENISRIQEYHATIDQLLLREDVADKFSGTKTGCWFIEEFHSDDDCNFGIASSDEAGLTSFPLHRHLGSKEYLICVTGRILLHIDNNVRVMETGDCACLPEGVVHYSKPLNGRARLVYICIPCDKSFNRAGTDERDK